MTAIQMGALNDEFTKEEFFARIDEARKQPGKSFAHVDDLDKYIRNL